MVDFSLDYAGTDVRKRVSSIQELSDVLGCSESLVKHMLKESGNPGRLPNGSYDAEKWKSFYLSRDGNLTINAGESARDIVLRERAAKAALAELKLERERGNLIPSEEVEKAASEVAARIKSIHFRSACVDLPSKLSALLGLDRMQTGALVGALRAFHGEFFGAVSDSLRNGD